MLIVPDTDGPWTRVAGSLWSDPLALYHPSGRPWILAPNSIELVLAEVGPVRVALIGSTAVPTVRLEELARRVHTLPDLDHLVRAISGSCHVVASIDGQVRAQGTVSGLRRVYDTRLHGVPVASDRAETLAALTHASVCDETLMVRVACGLVPPPLGERSTWTGVRAVPPEAYLALLADRARVVPWWSPPPPELPLPRGAALLGDALDEAVRARVPASGIVGADLSGGLDSTTLCAIAGRHASRLTTWRCDATDPGNDDPYFAELVAQRLGDAEHRVDDPRELPAIYADPATSAPDLEGPYAFGRTTARVRETARRIAAHGVGRQLCGNGGDELFGSAPAHLPALLRRRPVTAVRQLRGYRALYRWPLRATVAAACSGQSLGGWWRDAAAGLVRSTHPGRITSMDWGPMAPRAQDWVTRPTAESAARAFRSAAADLSPLGADRAQHRAMAMVRTLAGAYRQLSGLYTHHGVTLEMPYLDDRVVEAAMAVRAHERVAPERYKPLLADAAGDLLPLELRARSTKGAFDADRREGLRRHRGAVLDVFADSALAARGLIDLDVLRSRILSPQSNSSTTIALEHLLGCETWLRAAEGKELRAPTR